MRTSHITEVGTRAMLKQLVDARPLSPWSKAFLYRSDGHVLKLAVGHHIDNTIHIDLFWGLETDSVYSLEFVTAMDTCMDTATSGYVTLAVVNKTLDFNYTTYTRDPCKDIYHILHTALTCELCTCHRCMKPDEELTCLSCLAECREDDMSKHMCGVCHDMCNARIDTTACCKQYIHDACRIKCKNKCPYCRSALT